MLSCCLIAVVGCGNSGGPAPVVNDTATSNKANDSKAGAKSGTSPNAKQTGLTEKIKIKKANGDTAFSLKPQDDGAKLVDAQEQELARFNLKGSKLKIKDPADKVLGYVIASGGNYKIEDAEQKVELWKLQRQSDGDWKLEDGKDQLIYKIKKRDYGFEIEDGAEASLFKVKLKDGKTSLRDASEETVLSTKDKLPTISMTCLGLDAIDSLPIKTGLMTMLILNE